MPPGRTPHTGSTAQRPLVRALRAAIPARSPLLLLFGGLRSIAALLLGFAGLAVACAAAW